MGRTLTSMNAILAIPLSYSILIVILHGMAAGLQSQRLTFFARTLAAYGTLIACAIFGVIASLFFRVIGHHRMSQWATARSFKYSMRWTTNLRFEIISGQEYLDSVRPAVLIGNHQSALDILFLGTIWPRYCSVTAKKSLRYMPFLGWFMSLSGTVFINRSNRASAIQAFDRAAEEMQQARQSVFIFPEGTRSNAKGPELGSFKKGAFHLAIRAQVPILPVVCANYHHILSIDERRFTAGTIPIRVLPPVETLGLESSDAERLMLDVRASMLQALTDLHEEVKK